MTYCPHEEEYKGYTIRILHDESPPNPRKEQDNLGTLITWDRDYRSPDPHDFPDRDSFREWYEEHPAIALELWRGADDGYYISHFDGVDHFQGVAYIPADTAIREWPIAEAWERAVACLKAEVKEYSDWATGNCWGYEIGDPEADRGPIDSCWGFIGDWDADDYCLSAAREAVDHIVEAEEHERRVIDGAA